MTGTATISGSTDLVLPADGYDAFIDYLFNAPSQPQILEMSKGDIINAYNNKFPKNQPTRPVNAPASSAAKRDNTRSLHKMQSSKQPRKEVGFGGPSAVRSPSVGKSSLVVDDEETWQMHYEELKAYHDEHGNCLVPFGKKTGSLRSWTERQKKLYAASMLETDRIGDLKALDFDFTMKLLSTRSLGKAASAHSIEDKQPSARSIGINLAKPSSTSKTTSATKRTDMQTTKAKLPAPQAQMPSKSSLLANQAWNEHYETLKEYQAKHGNCDVPFGNETAPLRSWTERQRKLHKISRLEQAKVEKMEKLGFSF